MKSLLSLLLLSVLSLPSVVLGVDFDELVKRDGHWVLNIKDGTKRMTPFKVGDVTLDEGSGLYRNGRKVLSR